MSISVNESNPLDSVKIPTSRKEREKWGTRLTDISFDPEYTPGAFNAVNVCLRVQPSEQVCVITDEATIEIAAAIVRELEKIGAPYHAWVLEEVAERPLTDLPQPDSGRSGDEPGFDFCRAGADATNCVRAFR